MPNWEQLAKNFHPDYDLDYWNRIDALYEGGKKLLRDPHMMRAILVQQLGETEQAYQKRIEIARYIPYLGQVIDFTVAALGQSPISLKYEPENVDAFYGEFFDDVTKPAAKKCSLNQHARAMMLDGLRFKDAWTLVDLPTMQEQPRNRAEEEAMGLLDVYLCRLDPRSVINWETDDNGEFKWATVRNKLLIQEEPYGPRDTIVDTFSIYYPEKWERWEFRYKLNKDGTEKVPADKQEATLVAGGAHSFGRVPIVRMQLPPGLWAGNKLANLAESIFNKTSALDWNMTKTNFSMLVVKLQEMAPLSVQSQDEDRAINQPIGPGKIMQLAEKDSAEFVGPKADTAMAAREDLHDARDEFMRAFYLMSLSVENTGVGKGRSADSKKQDLQAFEIICENLGAIEREYCEEIIEMVARGRGEYGTFEVMGQGADDFDLETLDEMLEAGSILYTQIGPKSAHFIKRHHARMYRRALGRDVTDEDVELWTKELDANVTNEELAGGMGEDDEKDKGDKAA